MQSQSVSNSPSVDPLAVVNIFAGGKQTFLVTIDGSVLSSGENNANELGRHGKRSLLQRIDAVEAFSITHVAIGDGFCILLNKEGKMISWGQNAMGQLGNGEREIKEKPKLNSISGDLALLEICAGAQHVLALSKSGHVMTWGANRKGQLGDGQLTSCCIPKVVGQLLHRPVVAIASGESHCLALTIGGNVFAWGENTHGQLGTGDTVHRSRRVSLTLS